MKNEWLFIFWIVSLLEVLPVMAQNKQQKDFIDIQLAGQYVHEGKYVEAMILLENLIDKNFTEDAYKLLVQVYAQLDEKKKQEKLIKKAIKKSGEHFNYLIDLGTFYINNNNIVKGERVYDNLIDKIEANNSEIIQIANYFLMQRSYEYAIKTYQQARKIFKDDTKYTYEISYIYQQMGQNEEVAKEYILLLNTNPKMLSQIEVNINNLFNRDKDDKLYEVFSEVVLEYVKRSPENKEFNQLYYWLLIKKKDYSSAFIQAKAIDKRFNEKSGYQVNEFAMTTMNNGQYKYALRGFDYLIKQNEEFASQNQISVHRLMCLYRQFVNQINHTREEIVELKKEYENIFKTLGYNERTINIMQQYAELLAYYLQEPQGAVEILDSIINMPYAPNSLKAQCKLSRADIYLINGDVWEASLTYSQVDKEFKNEAIGSEAKYRNAMLSYYTNDFEWALSQFDALRSSTTKLIANDAMEYSLLIKENMDEDSTYKGLSWFAKADLALYQNQITRAQDYLDSIDKWYVYHTLFGQVLYKRAQIAIKEENFYKADSLLQEILFKYPYDLVVDDAIILLAQLNEQQFHNIGKAKEYYEKIILDYSSSWYVQQARRKYKELDQTIR
ncbi:MAG: tetratricopeptide repeat protein [Bacteroidales bacterium]